MITKNVDPAGRPQATLFATELVRKKSGQIRCLDHFKRFYPRMVRFMSASGRRNGSDRLRPCVEAASPLCADDSEESPSGKTVCGEEDSWTETNHSGDPGEKQLVKHLVQHFIRGAALTHLIMC